MLNIGERLKYNNIHVVLIIFLVTFAGFVCADTVIRESIDACLIPNKPPFSAETRAKIAVCLGWEADEQLAICEGLYREFPRSQTVSLDPNIIQLKANRVSLYPVGRSKLKGNVVVEQGERILIAETASFVRDPNTHQIIRIDLYDNVRFHEPGHVMRAKKVSFNPQDKSGNIHNALYRFDTTYAHAALPAWGLARLIRRFPNQDYKLSNTTYSTCAPNDKSWEIEAKDIYLEDSKKRGVAHDAVLRVHDLPLFYTPYISFPTSKERKSGFLMPMYGYSTLGGLDLAAPYYWSIAPNVDATLTPHLYGRRGVMLGGDSRFLTSTSNGVLGATLLPRDRAFHNFIAQNKGQFPVLRQQKDDRWSLLLHENTQFTDALQMRINYQQVSDDYYLQDFSTNLAILTENQLRREGALTYATDHWLFQGMAQSYQTLNPINQTPVDNIYERLPQIFARGLYDDLPFNAHFGVLGQFDEFHWPVNNPAQPEGPRYHFNPVLSFGPNESWGYVKPEFQYVENYYHLQPSSPYGSFQSTTENHGIPRASLDSGLFFDRTTSFKGRSYTQTLEPRLYYLYVPYQNQSTTPSFDSAYMIFSTEQLFRSNRFSGFDRIGDANQLAYALSSRWLSHQTGQEKASFSIGQLRYFSDRKVQLCYEKNGQCVDNSLMLGYLSPEGGYSPIASHGTVQLNSSWLASGDLIWDVEQNATNNGDFNFHYQPEVNHIVRFGYSYLVNGNLLHPPGSDGIQHNALHQATIGYAWPLSPKWSSLGAYSYNISERYNMMTFLGLQYDSCCWAVRLLGGRVFDSLSPANNLRQQYDNNVYIQVLLKGLGSVGSSDPASTIQSYLPGYVNLFQR